MKSSVPVTVVAAIIWDEDRKQILISRRVSGVHKAGCWEFPGGKVEVGETHVQALARELEEELNIGFSHSEFFSIVLFEYPEKTVELHFFEVFGINGNVTGMQGQEWLWVDVLDLLGYDFPEANVPVVDGLVKKFKLINNVVVG